MRRKQPNILRKLCHWEPPPLAGNVELNVDGAMFVEQHSSRVRVILQNEKGNDLIAASRKENELNDP